MSDKVAKPLGVLPLGDAAAYVEFSDSLDLEVNDAVQRLAAAVHVRALPWIRDVVPALGGLALHFDIEHEALPAAPLQEAARLVDECLKQGLPDTEAVGRALEVPICYDPELALDLTELAARLKLAPEEVARRHAAVEYRVLMMGFSPGLPYLGGLDPSLAVPRRATPRATVPAGSVAIANLQAVVYPYAIPGGWTIVGRTPLTVFDARRTPPSLFAPGDRVRFRPVPRAEFERLREAERSAS
ncbi:MAG TPA: 5-oxoprolinase subunit PxpB [Burkholderiales bacterium]|nr:5-oxoprolinase subunit PxpB [Burkholderiales bacterium]